MDPFELITEHSDEDFANAIRLLLPKGEYWQEADNSALTALILGMAMDFKVTNDEVQLALLGENSDRLFGWKISDYQALLITSGARGLVYDNKATPNLIMVSLDTGIRAENAWFEFEKKCLPHTEIQWIYNSEINVKTQVSNARHIRNVTNYEAL